MRRIASAALPLVLVALFAPAAHAAEAPTLWPPAGGPGFLHVHYGEEHLDDEDGPAIFPKVIADTVAFNPDVVVASADKSSNGTVENLTTWKNHMAEYDRAGIPYFAGVGNHDREALPGCPEGICPFAPLGPYMDVFADRPYPFGDAKPYDDAALSPKERPAGDPDGASSHYAFDYGNVRWLILDNSCFSFTNCDKLQNPPFPDAEGNQDTYDFLAAQSADAKAKGMLVFVSMHMPTQDNRPGHTKPTPQPHNMGEGTAPDNALFESAAAEAKVDGVFAAHIKGQWIYTAQGVPYFTDGGAGGEVYVNPGEPTGVDTGYWHGWRALRINGDEVVTDAVPVFVPGGVKITGPASSAVGRSLRFKAVGKQPTEKGPLVDNLELRDPDRSVENGDWLPEPARIWTSANPLVLAPVASKDDDPRRDRKSQTEDGKFAARCSGRTRVWITSGVERASQPVRVKSRKGRIVRRVSLSGRKLRVSLAQPAVVEIRLGKKVLAKRCVSRLYRRRVGGHGTLKVRVLSDRKPVVRRFSL